MADGQPAARYPAAALQAFTAAVLQRVDLPAADAARVAELMIAADLSGQDGHGIFRLPQYVRRIRGGAVNVRPLIRVQRTGPATALVDGDNGMGHLVMSRVADVAIALARGAGVAWVGVRASNHAGPAALYATMPLDHALIVVDPARFLPVDAFKREVDRHVRDLHASRRLPGVEAIYLPGEQRQTRIQERTARGIPLSAALVAELDRLAASVGVVPLSA